MREYCRDELDNTTFFGLYCPGPKLEPWDSFNLHVLIAKLETVKAILKRHYPNRKALTQFLKGLDSAIKSISKWDGIPKGKAHRR